MSTDPSSQGGDFLTPLSFVDDQKPLDGSLRGKLVIAGCCSGTYLSERVAERYSQLLAEAGHDPEVRHLGDIDRRFSNTETCVRLEEHVGGADVFLFQAPFDPVSNRPVDQNYMAFLIAARTFREHGARYVTGVLPYLAYSRQDKPTKFTREPTTARLMADLSIASGISRLITWDPHAGQIRGFYDSIPANMLDSLSLFINEFSEFKGRNDAIVVAPDAGASKFVTHVARGLGIKSAIAAKYRPKPEQVVISEIIGDFTGKRVAIIVDDMISGGGTIDALVRKLVEEHGIEEIHLGVSHSLLVGNALETLKHLHDEYNLVRVVITNSIPQTPEVENLPFLKVRCLSETFARVINRIHHDRSVSDVFYRPS